MPLGRNDPCHCGSGQKYKKCHLAADGAAALQRTEASAAPPALPDSRAMEATLADLRDLISPGRKSRRDAIDEAQDLMYDAWDTPDPKKRIALAHKALQVSPDCADAYVLLAQEASSSLEEEKELYEKGVEAGARALGPKTFREDAGHFWGLIETRPYMRARHGLAMCLREMGDLDGAATHFFEMLRLNPNDNQGIRYLLAACLLDAKRDDDLDKLLNEYEDDAAAAWVYAAALLVFRRKGDVPESRKQLSKALSANPFVPAYLLGRKKLPRWLPEYIGFGDESEAVSVAGDYAAAWSATAGALEWLRSASGTTTARPGKKAPRSAKKRQR